MSYPNGTVPTDRTVHPTPIYETLAMGLGAWMLWQLRDRFRAGVLFAIYLIYAGVERFLVEFLRRNSEVALGLTSAQFESLGMMVIGTIWILVVRHRHVEVNPVALRPRRVHPLEPDRRPLPQRVNQPIPRPRRPPRPAEKITRNLMAGPVDRAYLFDG